METVSLPDAVCDGVIDGEGVMVGVTDRTGTVLTSDTSTEIVIFSPVALARLLLSEPLKSSELALAALAAI